MTVPPRPPNARATHRPEPRWWCHLQRGDRIRCPRGHNLPRTFRVGESAYVRCCHQPPPGPPQNEPHSRQCGCWLYIFAVRAGGPFEQLGGGVMVVAVDYDELDALEAMETPAEVFTFLGVWPG